MYEDAPSWGQPWLNKDARGVAKQGGNWAGGQAWQVCAVKQVELAARPDTNLPKIAELFGPSIYFIDTVFAWGLVTCENPAHAMTRLDDLRGKTKLCLLAKQHFGLFGSEEGREWAVPCADYLEGIFSHQTASKPGSVIPLFPFRRPARTGPRFRDRESPLCRLLRHALQRHRLSDARVVHGAKPRRPASRRIRSGAHLSRLRRPTHPLVRERI